MGDQIGRIFVPRPVASDLPVNPITGAQFPLLSDYASVGSDLDVKIIEHRFGDLATMGVQRFLVSSDPNNIALGQRTFTFRKQKISYQDRLALTNFFEAVQGSFQFFSYAAYQPDRSFITFSVIFQNQPLSIDELVNGCTAGITFVEQVDLNQAPVYTVSDTVLRFPSSLLQTALSSQAQVVIPLIHIKVRESAVPDIYLSDRRCTVGGNLYLPRILNLGEPGSDVILTQDVKGTADNIQFTLGNADRVMTRLSNDTDLKYASIDLSLYFPESQILLQLWKGAIISFQSDGSPNFTIQCSDGLYQVNLLYPTRTISDQCWKTFDDGLNCPFSSVGSIQAGKSSAGVAFNADPNSCDYFFDSANGCQAHGMSPINTTPYPDKPGYFGGHPTSQQGVAIKDNSKGFVGFGRNTVTATSIASDTMKGQVLPEIWCDWGPDSDPLKAFFANAIVAVVRDEGDFMDLLGIVGAGPITRYAVDDPRPFPQGQGGLIVKNSDGYPYFVAPIADGFPCHGFKVDVAHPGELGDPQKNNDLGLRLVLGDDPQPTQLTNGSLGYDGLWVGMQGVAWNAQFSLSQASTGSSGGGYSPNPFYLFIGPLPFFLSGFFGNGAGHVPYVNGPGTAAGTAFVELRYAKPSGISPTIPDQHTMVIPIAKGLRGIIYRASNPTGTVDCITNPFWVATNSYLRALGLQHASTTGQGLTVISSGSSTILLANGTPILVLSSLYVGDGSGAGEIADKQVTPIVGNLFSTETQFQFQGTISQQKPFRDQLTEMLACALGYFSFEFGALKFGIRENASAVSAFTLGNIIYQSLSLTPIEQSFDKLIVDFADQAFQYQANTAEYYDKDHAGYMGRSGSPLTARQHVVGCATLSQGLRIAAVRTREEIGGIANPLDPAGAFREFAAARNATWKTTILALDTEVGQVVSLTHPDVPGGYDPDAWDAFRSTHPTGPVSGAGLNWLPNTSHFRIQKWTLHKDWSITVQAKTVTPSMYDLVAGPKPLDVAPPKLPILFYPQPLGEWAPYQVQASHNDAVFANEWTFDAAQNFTVLGDGTIQVTASITGNLPINQFIPNCGAPLIKEGEIAISPAGGQIPTHVTLRIAVCARNDATNQLSPPSDVVLIEFDTGFYTNQFTISDIQWPQIDGLTSYVVFASPQDDLICEIATGGLSGTAGNYEPKTITVQGGPSLPGDSGPGPLPRSTWMLPDPNVIGLRLKWKSLIHAGVLGAAVDTVNGSQITSNECIDVRGLDNWAGRKLLIIGRLNGSSPYQSFNITAFNPTTGTFTLDRDASFLQGGGPPKFYSDDRTPTAGDTIVVAFNGYNNSDNPLVIQDAGIVNATTITPDDPTGGMIPHAEKGEYIRVIAGTGRGQRAKVVDNDRTSWTLDSPIQIDADSVWIVEEAAWQHQVNASSTSVSVMGSPSTIDMQIANYQRQQIIVGAFTVDADNNEPGEADAPVRLLYVYGTGGVQFDRPYTFGIWDSTTNAKFLPLTIRNDSVSVDIVFEILDTPFTNVTVDIQLKRKSDGSTISIFPTPFVIPAGATGQIETTVFASSPVYFYRGDRMQFKAVNGDGSGTFSAILQTAIIGPTKKTPLNQMNFNDNSPNNSQYIPVI